MRVRLLTSRGLGITAVTRGTNGPAFAGGLQSSVGSGGQLTGNKLGVSAIVSGAVPAPASLQPMELEIGPIGDASYSDASVSDEYRSTVYFHCNSPLLGEQVVIKLDDAQLHLLNDAHIEFSFWHAFSAEETCHCFSFGYVRLVDTEGVVVGDGTHEVLCFEPQCRQSAEAEDRAKPVPGSLSSRGYPRSDLYLTSIGPSTTAEIAQYMTPGTESNPSQGAQSVAAARVPIKLHDRSSGAFDRSGNRPAVQVGHTGLKPYPQSEWRFPRRNRDMFVIRTFLQSTVKTTKHCLQVLRAWERAEPRDLVRAIRATVLMPARETVESFRLIASPLLEIISVHGNVMRANNASESLDAPDSADTSILIHDLAFTALVDAIHSTATDPVQAAFAHRNVIDFVNQFMCAPMAGTILLQDIAAVLEGAV